MIVNIGPWWFYDIIAFSTIIAGITIGLRRGFLITLYILVLQIIALVINLFIPTLLTNLVTPPIVLFFKKIGLISVLNSGAAQIGTVFMNLLKSIVGDSTVTFSWDGMGEELFKIIIATIMFLIFFAAILFWVNIIGLIIYRAALRKRLRRIRIVGAADSILGAFNGLAIGMVFSVFVSSIISLPFFATETQRLGIFNYADLSEEDKVEWAKNGNSYNRYSASKHMAFNLPLVQVGKYMYTNACIQKYLLDPAVTIGTQFINQNQTGSVFDTLPASVFDTYAQLMLEGYAASNPLKAPISTCIQIMPTEVQPLLRTVAEVMLVTPRSLLVNDGTNVSDVQTDVKSWDIMNAFEEFRTASELEVDYQNPNNFMTLARFKAFYSWAAANNIENPFIKAADYFAESAEKHGYKSDLELSNILKNPTRLYSLFRNVFYVNKVTSANPNIPVFAASAWSNVFVAQSMELTFNGQLGTLFSRKLVSSWSSLNRTSQRLITNSPDQDNYDSADYNGFWMKYYFDFADLNS